MIKRPHITQIEYVQKRRGHLFDVQLTKKGYLFLTIYNSRRDDSLVLLT